MNLGVCRFTVSADDENFIEYLEDYFFRASHIEPINFWSLKCIRMNFDKFTFFSALIPEAISTVKAGFTYKVYSHDGATWFRSDAGFEDYPHIIGRKGNTICFFYEEANESIRRLPLRLIREVSLREMENLGGIFVHCAFVSIGGRGLMICGDSGSGKSTTMIKLLDLPAARFVANDRGVVFPLRDDYYFVTWPLAVRLGWGTAKDIPRFSSIESALSRGENRKINESVVKDAENWGSKQKYELTPAELTSLIRCGGAVDGKIDSLLFPNLSLTGTGLKSELAVPDNASETLRRNINSPYDPEYGRGWMGIRTIQDKDLEKAADNFISWAMDRPIFDITGNPSASILEYPFEV